MYSLIKLPYVLGLWALAATCGPALGPIISGFSVTAKTWRWSLWEMLWLSGPIFVMMLLFLPETFQANILLRRAKRLRKLTGNDNYRSQSELDQAELNAREVVFEEKLLQAQNLQEEKAAKATREMAEAQSIKDALQFKAQEERDAQHAQISKDIAAQLKTITAQLHEVARKEEKERQDHASTHEEYSNYKTSSKQDKDLLHKQCVAFRYEYAQSQAQAKEERERAKEERERAKEERKLANKEREQAKRDRVQAKEERDALRKDHSDLALEYSEYKGTAMENQAASDSKLAILTSWALSQVVIIFFSHCLRSKFAYGGLYRMLNLSPTSTPEPCWTT